MIGPMPRGHWMTHVDPKSWSLLHPGGRYQVTRAFRDYDRFEHAEGETWTYLGFGFLPYDDGLSLFVSLDGEQEWHIRMQLRPDMQGPIVDHLQEYIMPLQPPPPPVPVADRGLQAPLGLFGVSFVAVLSAFIFFYQSARSPSFVVPGEDSLIYAMLGVVVGALGLLGGVIAMIWIARRRGRPHA